MGSDEEVLNKVVETIKNFLQVAREKDASSMPEIKAETDIYDDLGIDSLEAMDLVAEIEESFSISVNAQEMVSKRKIKDIVAYLQAQD